MSGYRQLTQGQRYQMEALLKAGHNQTMIATILSIHKSTVSRELRRTRSSGLPSKTSSRESYAETIRKTKNSHPTNYLGYGECPGQARLESRTNFQIKHQIRQACR